MKKIIFIGCILVLAITGLYAFVLLTDNQTKKTTAMADNDATQLVTGEKLSVTIPIYSGRADNPTWEITDPDELKIIRERISNLPHAAELKWPAYTSGGFYITNLGNSHFPKNIFVSDDIVVIGKYENSVYFRDEQYLLAKYLAMLARKNLSEQILPQWILDAPPYPIEPSFK